jgi:hypothetical protein
VYASGTIYGGEMVMSGTSTFMGGIVTGAYEFTEDAGFVPAMDMSVSDAPDTGDQMSYAFKIDGATFLKMYAEADGSGGIQNTEIRAYKNIAPSLNNLYDLGTADRSWKDIYASGTFYGGEMVMSGTSTFMGGIVTGAYEFTEDAGFVPAMDMSVSDGPSQFDQMSYTFNIDGIPFLKMFSEADGSGGIQAEQIRAYKDFVPYPDDTLSMGSSTSAWADIWATNLNGTPADYAEYFPSDEAALLTPGSVVALDTESATSVRQGGSGLRKYTIGVVSDLGAFIGNAKLADQEDAVLVGLMGQLDVKVDTASSSIAIGDELMMGANGYAVKAEGPGMVIGAAMEAMEQGTTGTVMAFVSPHWWAGGLLSVDANGSVLLKDLAVASSTVASASVSTVSSPLFTFRGTAYEEGSDAVIGSAFHLGNVVSSTSTAHFTITSDATTSSLLTVSEIGDVAVAGKFYPSDRGAMQYDRYIYYDGSEGAGGDRMRTNASGWGTGSFDFAEMFPSREALEPGDIVVVDPSNPEHVKRSTQVGEGAVVGIVSTQPGFLAGDNDDGSFPVALSGRVPTKVSAENGTIHAGDYLVASSEPGRAMKATAAGPTVGIALEDDNGSGTISAYVYVGWFGGTEEAVVEQSGGNGFPYQGYARILAGDRKVRVQHGTLGAYPMVVATPYGLAGNWWITEQSDTGFSIVIEESQSADVVFTWFVTPTPVGTLMWTSDETSNQVDLLTGNPLPATPESEEEASPPEEVLPPEEESPEAESPLPEEDPESPPETGPPSPPEVGPPAPEGG